MKEYSNYEIPPELASADAQLDPYPFFERMRAEAPVRYDEHRDVWDVFRYEDVVEVVGRPDLYSSAGTSHFGKHLLASDPPDHTVLRDVISHYFDADALAEREGDLRRRAEERLDRAVQDGSVEFVGEVAAPYTIATLCELLGIPATEWERYRNWTETLFGAPPAVDEREVQASHRRREETRNEMTSFFEGVVAEREDNPQEDLISTLVEAERTVDLFDRRLTLNTCNILMSAGHITTSTFVSNAVLVLTRQEAWGAIRSGEVALGDALEEVLRYHSPVLRFDRVTTETVELGGRTIPEDERLILWPASANRDERVFDEPDRFLPDRDSERPHVAFGQGIHTCIGNGLARLEARIVLSALLERSDRIEIDADSLEPFESTVLNGVERLPLRLTG